MSLLRRNLNVGKFHSNTALGFGMIFLFGITQGIQEFVSFMVLTIICTLGVSLLIWILLAFVIGTITQLIYRVITGTALLPDTKQTNPYSIALRQYIQVAQAKGFSRKQIEEELFKAGWPKAEIAKGWV